MSRQAPDADVSLMTDDFIPGFRGADRAFWLHIISITKTPGAACVRSILNDPGQRKVPWRRWNQAVRRDDVRMSGVRAVLLPGQ